MTIVYRIKYIEEQRKLLETKRTLHYDKKSVINSKYIEETNYLLKTAKYQNPTIMK